MDRRRVLGLTAAGLAVGLAGCSEPPAEEGEEPVEETEAADLGAPIEEADR